MNQQMKWERIAALTGLGISVVLVIRTLITPAPPVADGEAAVAQFFLDKQSVWLVGVLMTGLVIAFGTWFYAGIREQLARHGESRLGTVVFGSWIIVATIAMVRHAMLAVPALVPMPFDITVMLLTLASVLLGMVWFASAVTFAAVCIGGARGKAFPWWFNLGTLLVAIEMVLGGMSSGVAEGFLARSSNLRWVVLWTYIGWLAVASIVLYVQIGREAVLDSSPTEG